MSVLGVPNLLSSCSDEEFVCLLGDSVEVMQDFDQWYSTVLESAQQKEHPRIPFSNQETNRNNKERPAGYAKNRYRIRGPIQRLDPSLLAAWQDMWVWMQFAHTTCVINAVYGETPRVPARHGRLWYLPLTLDQRLRDAITRTPRGGSDSYKTLAAEGRRMFTWVR